MALQAPARDEEQAGQMGSVGVDIWEVSARVEKQGRGYPTVRVGGYAIGVDERGAKRCCGGTGGRARCGQCGGWTDGSRIEERAAGARRRSFRGKTATRSPLIARG